MVVARGTSNVDIMWIVNDTVKKNHSVNNTEQDTNLHYVDVYNITELKLSDNNTVCYCKAVINADTYGISSIIINNVTIGKHMASSYCYNCVVTYISHIVCQVNISI